MRYLSQYIALYPLSMGYAVENYQTLPKFGPGHWLHTVIYRQLSGGGAKIAVANIISRPAKLRDGTQVWEVVTYDGAAIVP